MKTIISSLPSRVDYLKGRLTVEIGYPWLSYGAIMTLEEILTLEMNVLEFGSGGSTVFFSQHCHSVKSLDGNQQWIDRVRNVLPVPSNVTFFLADHPKMMAVIQEEPKEYYDAILVDHGSIGNEYKSRRIVLEAVSPLLKKGGYLIIDNYLQRYLRSFDCSAEFDTFTFDDLRYAGRGTRICRKRDH